FIHFTTWNDFHEATTLDPSYSTLTSRLEISQVYLDRYFDRPSTVEPVDRPRAVLSYRKAIYPGEPLSFELLPLPSPGMPERGRWTIEIVDDHGRLVAQETSGFVSMDAMTPWVWEPEVAVDRGRTRALRIRASVELADGRMADYRHLPDVAIVPPVSVVDSLFYHVPLHRLSQAEDPPLRLLVNGQGPGVEPARHEGVRQVSIESSIDDL